MRRLFLLATLALVAAGLLAPASSPAATNVLVGVGNQRAEMFHSPLYQSLNLKRTRYFIRWNSIDNPGELALADEFVAAARASSPRVSVLMHISTEDLRERRGRLPSVSEYRRKVGALVRRYRAQGVREWGVWNEANHKTQPTWNNPARAASYYKVMRSLCKGCTIVALDVLDQKGYARYIARWAKAAGRVGRTATVIGIHNYSEVNRRRTANTRGIVRAVRRFNRRAKFWYTETGGLAAFGKSFPCSERRQAARTKYMFQLARRFRSDVKRLYVYNWTGTDCSTRFDAGLVGADGRARPAYTEFKRNLRNFRR